MKHEELIAVLNECASFCNYCADACLSEDNLHKMVTCIRYDRICAESCASFAKILSIDISTKELIPLAEFCLKFCKKCAEECENHDNQHCQNCAQACEKCADACSKFIYAS